MLNLTTDRCRLPAHPEQPGLPCRRVGSRGGTALLFGIAMLIPGNIP
jgi:hypothetical protein